MIPELKQFVDCYSERLLSRMLLCLGILRCYIVLPQFKYPQSKKSSQMRICSALRNWHVARLWRGPVT